MVSALRSLATAQEAGNGGEGGDGIGTDGMGRGAVVSFAIGARVDVAITADDAPRSQGATGLEAAVELGAVGTAAARSAARRAREEAAQLARRSDVVILALGDTSRTAGEWADRSSLELAGDQPALLAALLNVGTPVVLVVVGGRPVTFGGPSGDTMLQTANLSSLLFTYPPGQELPYTCDIGLRPTRRAPRACLAAPSGAVQLARAHLRQVAHTCMGGQVGGRKRRQSRQRSS